jgi:hypothetical protein
MTCLVCGAEAVVQELDLGSHPVASFFLQPGETRERRVPLAVGQCERCATIQLMKPIPAEALVPPYDWLTAREPEAHLDGVVDHLMTLPGVGASSSVAGVSYKDDTTLDRFRARGLSRTWRVDLREDLAVTDPAAGVETLQKLVTAEAMRRVAGARGQADILIVRHIAEHAEDPREFLAGCAELIAEGGYVVVEVPDCTRSLELNDYAMVWEEHSLYLTPATTEQLLVRCGFATVSLDVHPFPFENSIVLVGRKTSTVPPAAPEPAAAERSRLNAYASAFEPVTSDLRGKLTRAARRGPVAIFGAGHLACAFINFHGLEDLIDFVVDDTPQKQNLRLPGAQTPILPSSSLVERGASLCLLAVSPQSEDGIIARNSAFQDRGGVFRSVLAASARSIRGEFL